MTSCPKIGIENWLISAEWGSPSGAWTAVAAVIFPFVNVSRTCTTPNTRRPSPTVTVLPVTVFVVLDGFGVGFGVGLAVDFVEVGDALAVETLDVAAAALLGAELAAAELTGTELAAVEPTGVDESGGADAAPGVTPESAAGRGALAGAVLKLSRTTSPVAVATNTVTKRRMTHPPSGN